MPGEENTSGTGTAAAGSGAAGGASSAGAGAAAAAGSGAAPAAAGAGGAAGGTAGGSQTQAGAAVAAAGAAAAPVTKEWWETEGGTLDLKVPEELGTLMPEIKTDIESWAKEGKLAADVVNKGLELFKKGLSSYEKNRSDQWKKQQEAWLTKDLPAAFGNAEAFKQGKQDTSLVMSRFADKETQEFLKTTGIGAHPAFAKFTARIGAFIREKTSEDSSSVEGGQGSGSGMPMTPKERRVNALYVKNPPAQQNGAQK